MVNLAVHPWMLDSTMRNIQLIDRLSKQRLSSVQCPLLSAISNDLSNSRLYIYILLYLRTIVLSFSFFLYL